MAGASTAHLFRALFEAAFLGTLISMAGKQKMGFMGIAKINHKDLVILKELMEAGKLAPVIDGCYPLSETAEALRYFANVHAKGKVVITMEPS